MKMFIYFFGFIKENVFGIKKFVFILNKIMKIVSFRIKNKSEPNKCCKKERMSGWQ